MVLRLSGRQTNAYNRSKSHTFGIFVQKMVLGTTKYSTITKCQILQNIITCTLHIYTLKVET